MKLRELIKRKLPATFNAAEYETGRILTELKRQGESQDALLDGIRHILTELNKQEENQNALLDGIMHTLTELKGQGEEHHDAVLKAVQQTAENQQSDRKLLLQDVERMIREATEAQREYRNRDVQLLERLEKKQQDIEQTGKQISDTLSLQEYRQFRFRAKPTLYLELHVAEQCNLNCKMCSHFSCLAEREFLEPADFERDMRRLAELFDNGVELIKLLGGEPLLNPHLPELCRIARRYFPENKLFILTNGTLLPKMTDEFWDTCKSENVTVMCTEYPIEFDYHRNAELAREKGVVYERVTYELDDKGAKVFHHLPLDLSGWQNPVRSYQDCFEANSGCVTLYHGRIFTCTVAANARHFKKYFHSDITLSPRDSIDIYEAKSAWEIMDFLAKPIPFCRYCDVEHRTFDHTWGRTKRDIHEWTLPYPGKDG